MNALNQETRVWIREHDPNAVTPEYHAEADIYALRLDTEPPPLRFMVTASNIIHQLRATLDNLVWQLVLANGRKPRGGQRGNGFPILFSHHDHDSFAQDTTNALRGVHEDCRALIERLQPYQHPPNPPPYGHPLRELRELSNADKHQELKLGSMRGDAKTLPVLSVHGNSVESWEGGWFEAAPILNPGAVVGWLQVRPGGEHPDMYVEVAALSGVCFRDSGKLLMLLRVLLAAVKDIVTAFVPAMIGLLPLPVEVVGRALVASYEREAAKDPLTATTRFEAAVWNAP